MSYEQREDFARRALANIHTRLGEVTNLIVRLAAVEEGLAEEQPVDRVVFDLPEPWRLVDRVARVLRSGGIFISYVPTIIQSQQIARRSGAIPATASSRPSRRSSGPGTSTGFGASIPPDGCPHGVPHRGPTSVPEQGVAPPAAPSTDVPADRDADA